MPSFSKHLGEAYIQAFLASHGITSKQVTPATGSTLQECVDHILATDVPIVGFTCFDNNYYLVRAIASLLKQRRPETVVITGGPSATFSDDVILAHTPDIDVCVRFEGEETTLELTSKLLEGAPLDCLDDIAGISFRRGSSIVRTPDRPLFLSDSGKGGELDGLPSPYLEGVLDGTEGAGVLTARGCVHRCTFCNFAAMSRHRIRYHSIDRVIDELRVIQATMETTPPDSPSRQVVTINDDAFTLNISRAKDICRRIVNEGISLHLSCLCRADNLDEELVELLRQAGFLGVNFGLESAVPRVLRNIKKVCSIPPRAANEEYAPEKQFLSQVKDGISLAKRHNMWTSVSIILGLPGETIEEGLQTVDFVRSLNVDHYSHNVLVAFPGTEIFNTASEFGIGITSSDFLLPYSTNHAYSTSAIPFDTNSSIHRQACALARIILRAFAGETSALLTTGRGIVLAIVETGDRPNFLDPFSWLSGSLAVSGRVIILGEEGATRDDFIHMLRSNSASGLPTRECYYLRKCAAEDAEVIYKPFYNRVLRSLIQFPIIRLSKHLAFTRRRGQAETRNWPIYSLSEETDVYLLSAMADLAARQVDDTTGNAGHWLDGVILDGCRWSKSICPALDLRRVIISQAGEIRPCVTGQPLGTLADGVHKLRERARAIYAKLREDRNCKECPAEPRCAKCLFPYPMSTQDYCEMQRASPDVAGIVVRAKLANTFNIGADGGP